MQLSDATPGARVKYIPGVANGDPYHPDCETGFVSTHNDQYVFVKFDQSLSQNNWDNVTSQSCKPEDLLFIHA